MSADTPLRVLIVDDEPSMREVYASLFEFSEGFEVVGAAKDGPSALAAADELDPDVALVDVRMPGGGEAAVRSLAERGTIVVGMSAHEEAGLRDRLERAGAAAFVVKGGPLDDLLQVLSDAVGVNRQPERSGD